MRNSRENLSEGLDGKPSGSDQLPGFMPYRSGSPWP